MKIIISENQLKSLLEQSDYAMDRRGNALLNATGIRSDKDYETVNKSINAASNSMKVEPHTAIMILGIGAAFIPVVGPFLAAGIGLADAALYYKEGDTKSAGMSALFSIIPVVGPIANKIPGIKQLGAKGMSALASKISKGVKITDPVEISVVNAIGKDKEFVQGAVNNYVKSLSQQAAAKTTNSSVKSSLLGIAKTGLVYGSAGVAYDYGYDGVMKKIEQDNINTLKQKLRTKQ